MSCNMIQSYIFKGLFFIFILLMASNQEALAQNEISSISKKIISIENIQKLKDGALILPLKSDRFKLAAYQRIIDSQTASESAKLRAEKMKSESNTARNLLNKNLISAFLEKFDFTEVYFIYDSSTTKLISGHREGIFLNEKGVHDPSISLDKSDFFIFRAGRLDPSDFAAVDSYIMFDSNSEPLTDPFPYYISTVQIIKGIKNMGKESFNEAVMPDLLARNLNRNLAKFYKRSFGLNYTIRDIRYKKSPGALLGEYKGKITTLQNQLISGTINLYEKSRLHYGVHFVEEGKETFYKPDEISSYEIEYDEKKILFIAKGTEDTPWFFGEQLFEGSDYSLYTTRKQNFYLNKITDAIDDDGYDVTTRSQDIFWIKKKGKRPFSLTKKKFGKYLEQLLPACEALDSIKISYKNTYELISKLDTNCME